MFAMFFTLRVLLQEVAATIDPQVLAGLTTTVLSLIMTYVPGLSDWHAGLAPTPRRLFWIAVLFVTSAGWLTYTCQAQLACVGLNALDVGIAFLQVLIGGVVGQLGTYSLSTEPRRITVKKMAAKAAAGEIGPPG